MTIKEIIQNDAILSRYDYSMAYTIVLRLMTLGYIPDVYQP